MCEKQIEPSISECEQKGGVCRISCFEDEESDYYSCSIFSDSCCFESGTLTPPKPKSKWWIWVLVILILLTLLGIIFRDKLRPYYYKYFSKSGGPLSRLQRRPPFPPPRGGVPLRTMPPLTRGPISPGNFQKPRTPSTPQTGPGVPRPGVPPQRKILPPQANQQTQKKDSGKNPELEDVLKKLKDMGK